MTDISSLLLEFTNQLMSAITYNTHWPSYFDTSSILPFNLADLTKNQDKKHEFTEQFNLNNLFVNKNKEENLLNNKRLLRREEDLKLNEPKALNKELKPQLEGLSEHQSSIRKLRNPESTDALDKNDNKIFNIEKKPRNDIYKKIEKLEITTDDFVMMNKETKVGKGMSKFRPDCFRRKIKCKLNEYILESLNIMLLQESTNRYLLKLPMNVIHNTKKNLNKRLLTLPLREVFYIQDSIEMKSVYHNIDTITSVHTIEFNESISKSMKDWFKIFRQSSFLKNYLISELNKEGKQYVYNFIYYLNSFLRYFQIEF